MKPADLTPNEKQVEEGKDTDSEFEGDMDVASELNSQEQDKDLSRAVNNNLDENEEVAISVSRGFKLGNMANIDDKDDDIYSDDGDSFA